MKKVLILIIFTVGLSVPLWCETEPNRDEIKEILELLGYTEAYPKIYKETYDSLKENVMKAPVPEELEKEFHELVDQIMNYFSEQASWEVYEDIYIDYFNENYTSTELVALGDFLKTPAGQKFYINMPAMSEKITSITQEKMAYILPEIQKMITMWMIKHQDTIEKLKKDSGGNG